MRNRRCVSAEVVETDAFYSMPASAQALYLHLCLLADDDGFVSNAELALRRLTKGRRMLIELTQRGFILAFEKVYVIRHWRVANSLKLDRIQPLSYPEIAKVLWVNVNRSYTEEPAEGCPTLWDLRGGIRQESDGFRNVSLKYKEKDKKKEKKPYKEKSSGGQGVEGGINETERRRAFDALLENYPKDRRGSREEAYRAYCRFWQEPGAGEEMRKSLDLWKQSHQWCKEGGNYVPMLVNWLTRELWRTRPGKMEIPQGASGHLGQAELEAIRAVMGHPSPAAGPDLHDPAGRRESNK